MMRMGTSNERNNAIWCNGFGWSVNFPESNNDPDRVPVNSEMPSGHNGCACEWKCF